MGRNPPNIQKLSNIPTTKGTKRDKAQLVWEDRLIARREEREIEELQAKIQLLETELAPLKDGGAGPKGERTIESCKERIKVLEVELDEAESSLKDLTATHAQTQHDLANKLEHLSSADAQNPRLERRITQLEEVPPVEKTSGLEVRQLRGRVEHVGRQLDAKAKELAQKNHALVKVSSEMRITRENKERILEKRAVVEAKVERLVEELEVVKEARASKAALPLPAEHSPTSVRFLVETVRNLSEEVDSLRTEGVALLLTMVAKDS